jgi:hypothetical protein
MAGVRLEYTFKIVGTIIGLTHLHRTDPFTFTADI